MASIDDAAVPDGLRLYAIGDIHGCFDMFEAVVDSVMEDLERDPPGDWRVILVGDYIDRGPDSRSVLEWLAENADRQRWIPLCGNHDRFLLDFLDDPDTPSFPVWLANGGEAMLASCGLRNGDPFSPIGPGERRALQARLAEALGPEVHAFLDRLVCMARFGDYAFVHAGVRPGVRLDRQDPDDLIWIRDPFLASDADFGAVIVHGHTPTESVVVRHNRIGIDTGAVYGGALSCIVLEGRRRWLLDDGARSPLP